jgi:hypothetical protein
MLEKKVVQVRSFSQYFINYSKGHNLIYVFDLLIHKDDLYRYRGLGKKSIAEVKRFLDDNFNDVEKSAKEVEEIIQNISKFEIKSFPKIVESKAFKKLRSYFRDLHKKGYSIRKILPELADENIGLLYKPQNRHMNNEVFLEIFARASDKNKSTLLRYLKAMRPLFIETYQEEIIKHLRSRRKETFETLP